MPYKDPAQAAARLRRYRKNNPGYSTKKNADWKAANRAKYLAHKAVENALVAGRLTKQPCERCGTEDKVHAHHDDYSKPLEVRWLCPPHHKERHREMLAESAIA